MVWVVVVGVDVVGLLEASGGHFCGFGASLGRPAPISYLARVLWYKLRWTSTVELFWAPFFCGVTKKGHFGT